MGFRPSFTEVKIVGDKVRADGLSVAQMVPGIRHIFVGLHQGDRMEYRRTLDIDTEWTAEFDVVDGSGTGMPDFERGPILAIGVELHVDPLRVITWTESCTLEEKATNS